MHKVLGHADPTQTFLVRKMLRGCHKLLPSADIRLPITRQILEQILEAINHTVPIHINRLLLKAIFLLCFHAFLRMGEAVVKNKAKRREVIQLSDVTFQTAGKKLVGMQLVLHNFKTKKDSTPTIITLETNVNEKLCPVKALHSYQSIFKHNFGPLFQFIDGVPVSYSYVSDNLSKAISFIGLNPANYKNHSFRIGSATLAAQLGYSENVIQSLGRWNLNAVRKYIRIPAFKL